MTHIPFRPILAPQEELNLLVLRTFKMPYLPVRRNLLGFHCYFSLWTKSTPTYGFKFSCFPLVLCVSPGLVSVIILCFCFLDLCSNIPWKYLEALLTLKLCSLSRQRVVGHRSFLHSMVSNFPIYPKLFRKTPESLE